jgi:F0F1-type ATP synthase assembly protein I
MLILNNSEKPSNTKFSSYAKFSAIGFQMAAIIALFTFLGTYLDDKNNTSTPWWTIGFSLTGVISALALVIREVLRMNKDND